MTITVCFFASLREQLGCDRRELDFRPGETVGEIWQRVAADQPAPNILAAINHKHASMGDAVQDGDEVAFFPPVTGG